jgi:hypothetical protein
MEKRPGCYEFIKEREMAGAFVVKAFPNQLFINETKYLR